MMHRVRPINWSKMLLASSCWTLGIPGHVLKNFWVDFMSLSLVVAKQDVHDSSVPVTMRQLWGGNGEDRAQQWCPKL